jgi:hypothetical protein
VTAPSTSWLAVAGLCSAGAGAVHAAAAGAHGEHRSAALAFALLAAAQLLWGGAALLGRDRSPAAQRALASAGVVLAAAAVGGWVLAKTTGLPVDGLGAAEPVQTADSLAAGSRWPPGCWRQSALAARTTDPPPRCGLRSPR